MSSDQGKKPRVVALMPMRHNSQRVPRKNFRLIHGKPLFHWTLETLLSCKEIDQVVIDTDSPDIIQDCQKNFPSVVVLERPAHLCADETAMNDILLYDTSKVEADFYLQTHSTNPLLKQETVSQALQQLLAVYPQRDSLFAVKRLQTRLWNQLIEPINHNKAILLQTQDLPPVYEENSCLYVFTRSTLENFHNRIGTRPIMFEMTHKESVDIDTEWEFKIAELLLKEEFPAPAVSTTRALFRIEPTEKDLSPKPTILVSAPYMLQNWERFKPILESFGVNLLVPEVHERLTEEELLQLAGQFDGTISGDDKFSRKVLEKCAPRLKVLSKWGTGVDSFDAAAAKENDIQIRRTPDAFSVPVSESVLGYMLAFARRQPWMNRAMQDHGEWKKIAGKTLSESTLGVIGCGDVGKSVLRRAQAFGMKLLGYDVMQIDPKFVQQVGVKMVSLEELLKNSDFVSVNCDYTPSSHHLIGDVTLSQMKPTAILINTARGPIVDEPALVRSLQQKQIAGAAMDVFEHEPLPQDSPLRKMDNVMMAPHNSNSSPLYWEYVHWNTIKNCFEVLGVPFKVVQQ